LRVSSSPFLPPPAVISGHCCGLYATTMALCYCDDAVSVMQGGIVSKAAVLGGGAQQAWGLNHKERQTVEDQGGTYVRALGW
jgi:hypothetical protein